MDRNKVYPANPAGDTDFIPMQTGKEKDSTRSELNPGRTIKDELAIEKKIETKSKCDLIKKKIYRFIESNFMQALIILLSCFSVINDDLRLCALPKTVDGAFFHINEFIFCFFVTEFVVLCVVKTTFIGSFYFWIDLLSIISLIPETHFIWVPIELLIIGNDSDSLDGIVQTGKISHATKASALGAKASKLLKLVKIVSFINVIRVAKMIEATRSLSKHKSKFAMKQIKEIKRQIHVRNRRRSVFDPAQIEETVKMSMKYLSVYQQRKRPMHRNHTIMVSDNPKTIEIMKLESQKTDNAKINLRKSKYGDILRPIVKDETTVKQTDRKITRVINPIRSNPVLKKGKTASEAMELMRKKFEDISNVSCDHSADKMSKGEEMKLNERVERNRRLINEDLFKNLFEAEKDNKSYLPSSRNSESLSCHSESEVSLYSTVKKKENKDQHDLLTFHTNLLILNENNKSSKNLYHVLRKNTIMEQTIEKPNEFEKLNTNRESLNKQFQEDEELENLNKENSEDKVNISHDESESSSDEENNKQTIKTSKLLMSGKKFKLEKNLSEMIIRKVLLIVLASIVFLPIIEINSMQDFLYSQNELLNKQIYCYDSISRFIQASKKNPEFLKGLNITLSRCFNLDNRDNDDTPILLINLTTHEDYKSLVQLYPNMGLPLSLSINNISAYISKYRQNSYYVNLTFEEDSGNIIILEETQMENRLAAFLNLVKSFVVAIVLIVSATLFNKDVINYVISPLDKIFSRLQYHLKNFDPYMLQEDEIKLIQENEQHAGRNDLSDKENRQMETFIIEMTLKKLVSLLSSSIGKSVLMLIPNCDLNSNFLNINCHHPAINFDAVFLSLKIRNLDKFITDYKEKANVFLNKIYYLFHSIGCIFLGDVVMDGNLIIWKRKEEFLSLLDDYSNLITGSEEKPPEESSFKDPKYKRSATISPVVNQYINLSIICGIKFISSVYREIEGFNEICQKYDIQLFLYADYGPIFYGYYSTVQKLNHLFVSQGLCHGARLFEFLDGYGRPSLFLSQKVYSRLDAFLKKNIYQAGIVQLENKVLDWKLYKQYFNYDLMEEHLKKNSKKHFEPLSLEEILKKRKDLEKIIVSKGFQLEDIIIYDTSSRDYVYNFPQQIKVLIGYAFNKISKLKYSSALNSLQDLLKMDCSDPTIPKMIKRLITVILEYESGQMKCDYTILLKNKKIVI